MASPFCRVIRGRFVIVGKEPDGDSVRFIADNPRLYRALRNQHRIRLSRDGSVQLRFEGVDAPEVHYGSAAQPLGTQARDQLLGWMGFTNIQFAGSEGNRVQAATPESVAGVILSKAAEANGRPVSYVMLASEAQRVDDGDWIRVDEDVLQRTLNFRLLEQGMAYYTVYTSTAFDHREFLRTVAAEAREADRGVWAQDVTSEFILEDDESLGPGGQLILPKLFRRCTDYLKDVQGGFRGNLADWLVGVSAGGSRSENDRVLIEDRIEVSLSDLIDQRNRRIAFQADLLNITFVEKR